MSEANALLTEIYSKNGVEFHFPEFWEFIEEKTENELTITINSPETSFWILKLFSDGVDPEEVIATAEEAFLDEYDDVDSEIVEETISQRESVGRDLGFSCQDLTNSVSLRAFRTGQFTVFIYYQGTDHELEETLPILNGMLKSVRCTGDDMIFG